MRVGGASGPRPPGDVKKEWAGPPGRLPRRRPKAASHIPHRNCAVKENTEAGTTVTAPQRGNCRGKGYNRQEPIAGPQVGSAYRSSVPVHRLRSAVDGSTRPSPQPPESQIKGSRGVASSLKTPAGRR